MDGSILALLEQHGSLAYEQIAAHLNEPPDAVRSALGNLRHRNLVDVLGISEVEGHGTREGAYWRLTDAGRLELSRMRSS
jgi:predicted ArsR family transcriptional regulator